MLALVVALLLASPALDAARKSLAEGKTDGVLFALEAADAVPKEEALQAAAVLVDAGKLADQRGDKPMALLLVQNGLKKQPGFAPALELLGGWSLRDNEFNLAISYGRQWVKAQPDDGRAKAFLAHAEEAERTWAPPGQPEKKQRRRHRAAHVKAAPKDDAPAQQKTITLYGNEGCRECRKAQAWLTKRGLAWAEVDVDKDQKGARELQQKRIRFRINGTTLPMLEVNGVLIEGFNPRALDAALARQ